MIPWKNGDEPVPEFVFRQYCRSHIPVIRKIGLTDFSPLFRGGESLQAANSFHVRRIIYQKYIFQYGFFLGIEPQMHVSLCQAVCCAGFSSAPYIHLIHLHQLFQERDESGVVFFLLRFVRKVGEYGRRMPVCL